MQPQNDHKMTIFGMLWNDFFLPLFCAAHETINKLNAANKKQK
jgi:hypothetical protein